MAILMGPRQYYLHTEEGRQKLKNARREVLRIVRELVSKGRYDTKRAVEEALAFTKVMNPIACVPTPDKRKLRFHTNDVHIIDLPVPRAVGILRMMCARLSVIASEATGTMVSPYGEKTTFPCDRGDGKPERIELEFTNTPDKQEFDLFARGAFDQQ